MFGNIQIYTEKMFGNTKIYIKRMFRNTKLGVSRLFSITFDFQNLQIRLSKYAIKN